MTITFGDLTIDRIVEQEGPFFDPLTFLPDLTPELLEANRPWLDGSALDTATGKLILCIQSYVVRTPHHTILIDTCVGNHKDRPTHPFWNDLRSDTYLRGLTAAGLAPEDIDIVMCTPSPCRPCRLEHPTGQRPVGTDLSQGAVRVLRAGAGLLDHAERRNAGALDRRQRAADRRRRALRAGDQRPRPQRPCRLEPTPGHTPDHFAVQLGRGGTDAVLSGDLIHSPLQGRYPELSMRADHDPVQAARTRRKFLECYCDTETLVCTAHFPQPSTARVTRWDEGFRFVAAAS